VTFDKSRALHVAGVLERCDGEMTEAPWVIDDTDGRASIESQDGYAIAYPAEHKSMHTILARGRDNNLNDANGIAVLRNHASGAAALLKEAAEEVERFRELASNAPHMTAVGSFIVCGESDGNERVYCSDACEHRDSLQRDLAAAREEVTRMRTVYEAAIEWSESFGELSKRLPPHVHKLRAAVDAAAKETP
jgi:hypothetical protein